VRFLKIKNKDSSGRKRSGQTANKHLSLLGDREGPNIIETPRWEFLRGSIDSGGLFSDKAGSDPLGKTIVNGGV